MDEVMIQKLLDILDDVVRADGTYKEKRDEILKLCKEDEKTNLIEFVSWFDPDETEEVQNG
jgi:hypothetical protein